jgi:mRNA-degrading endonuclease RelE of RelBE toxin-antitoxin system
MSIEQDTAGQSGTSSPLYEVHAANQRRLTRELLAVPLRDLDRLQRDVESLAINPRPRGAVCLGDDVYRIRRGDWRIIYKVLDTERLVLIGGVRRRDERTYRGIPVLFR